MGGRRVSTLAEWLLRGLLAPATHDGITRGPQERPRPTTASPGGRRNALNAEMRGDLMTAAQALDDILAL
jgi:hypothetical protein